MPRVTSWGTPTAVTLACVLCLSACSDAAGATGPVDDAGDGAQWVDLVSADAWRRRVEGDDPLATHRPPQVDCPMTGWYAEREELEISTARCNYLDVEQAARTTVGAGDRLSLLLRHFNLSAPEPTDAHVALLFEDAVVWETTVAIPSDAQVLDVQWVAARALPEGAPVAFHLHNHGQNTWTLAHVRVLHR